MSTYYFLLCFTHEEYTDAVSRAAGSNNFLGEGEKTLLPFIIAHCGCDIKIINEDQLEEYDYDLPFQEWKASRIIQEIERVSQDGRWK